MPGSSFVQTNAGNEAARHFGMKEAPVPVKKSVEYLVATVSISLGFLDLGIASLMNMSCRLTGPLETRLPAGFRLLRARTGPGDSSIYDLLSRFFFFDLHSKAFSLRSILQSHLGHAALYRYILVQVYIAQVREFS